MDRRAGREILPDFEWREVAVNGTKIHFAIGGDGPPLLLLHGHPQTHLTWHKVAPVLARRYKVVLPDLRGYGDSAKPAGGEGHVAYSKREMALDQICVMRSLGFRRFQVIGHDRGARVAHRMALDHPAAIERLVLLDIAPTATMYARTDMEFARRYFWWFFLIQPYPLPERLIAADPDFFLDQHLSAQIKIAGAADERVVAQYRRCYSEPATRHAICEDYRASAGIDLLHDNHDRDTLLQMPLLVLWGALGTVGALYDVLSVWAEKATDVQGRALYCGHSPQEEVPEALLKALDGFLNGAG